VRLGVVIDQHRGAVGGPGQAVPLQAADFRGPAAGVHEQLDRDPGFPAGDDVLQLGQLPAEPAQDLSGNVPAGLTRVRLGRDVPRGQGEVLGQAAGRASVTGQALYRCRGAVPA